MFPDEEIAEAAGVLEMISQTPEQQLFYNARLKFQRDEQARLDGEARGLKIGRITLLQELLGIPKSTTAEFAGYDESQFNDLAEKFQRQLRARA